MHVVFIVTRGDAVGGATVHVRDVACGLEQHGARATVLLGGTGEALDELARAGLTCRSLSCLGRSIHPLKDPLALAQLVGALIDLKPDLVCTHTAKAGLLGRAACALLGIPAVYTPHGWTIEDRISRLAGRIFQFAERAGALWSSRIVNVCEAERELARRYRIAPDEKLTVIHNGVHDVAPTLHASPASNPPRLAMVARFEEPKDHATLLRALARLKHLAWRLDLIGSGPRRDDVRRLALVLGIGERVDFVSGVPVAERLARAQVFVLASRSEGFPLSILEAMRAGLPVVASQVGGIAEAVADGESGILVPPGDPDALGAALRLVLTNCDLRARLGSRGRRRYERHFTFDAMFARTCDLYHGIVAASARKAVATQEGI